MESKFDGGVLEYLGYMLLIIVGSIFTLSLATPWLICMFFRWEIGHTVINGKRLQFKGTGGQLFFKYIIWIILCIITLGIYQFFIYVKIRKWKIENTSFIED